MNVVRPDFQSIDFYSVDFGWGDALIVCHDCGAQWTEDEWS